MRDRGLLPIEQRGAAELSPWEFAQRRRDHVDPAQAKNVVIDSLNEYQTATREENALSPHVHKLITSYFAGTVITFVRSTKPLLGQPELSEGHS